jgi:biopolymer transport protein ExbD
MKLKRRVLKRGRVEIIPMIDTILILLIFYMSFSTFSAKEKRIDAKLPLVAVASAKAPTTVPLDITLHVRDKDHILVNNAAVYDATSLRDAMLQLGSIGQEATIVIEAEPDTQYQAVIVALDACAEARLTKVAFRPLAEKPAATP